MTKSLRVVSDEERGAPTLLEAVESGDVLAILKAQRRIIAESLVSAGDNTKPQFSNELSKLTAAIATEEARRSKDDDGGVVVRNGGAAWDASAI